MLLDARTGLPTFKYWSPMSVGAWVLFVFGLFATLSFVEALVLDGRLRHPLARRVADGLAGGFGRLFMIVGACLGLFIAGYTGVLLAVSNQPVWSDTWALGGLFLASGLSTAAAAIALFAWWRRDARPSRAKLSLADRYFLVLELILLAIFFMTLGPVAPQVLHGGWLALWALVLVGILIPLVMHRSVRDDARPGVAPRPDRELRAPDGHRPEPAALMGREPRRPAGGSRAARPPSC